MGEEAIGVCGSPLKPLRFVLPHDGAPVGARGPSGSPGRRSRVSLKGMARNFKITAAKRARERALVEKRQNKLAKRNEAKQDRPASADGAVDPDIAGIVPGPQPPQWWQEQETDEE